MDENPPNNPEQQQHPVVGTDGRSSGQSSTRVAAGQPAGVRRPTAAERRLERRYFRPTAAIYVSWNLGLALVAAVMLIVSSAVGERPPVILRVMVACYAVQCVVHTALFWVEYRRGRRLRMREAGRQEDGGGRQSSFARHCGLLYSISSNVWRVVAVYLVSSFCREELLQDAPRLYWLTAVFLAIDMFFVICYVVVYCLIGIVRHCCFNFMVGIARFCYLDFCVVGIAVCFCWPCIIALRYALSSQEGASDADIDILPRYRFAEPSGDDERKSIGGALIPITNVGGCLSDERVLLHEDAECCICLTPYEDGVELHQLPCNHHFHSACIVTWLRIDSTCPLCKYNILDGNDCQGIEIV